MRAKGENALHGNRGGGNTGKTMNKFCVTIAAMLVSGSAFAASAVNRDAETRTLIVTEGSSKSELAIASGQTVDFCDSGCFVTMPNGDREALTGSESIEIIDGTARIK